MRNKIRLISVAFGDVHFTNLRKRTKWPGVNSPLMFYLIITDRCDLTGLEVNFAGCWIPTSKTEEPWARQWHSLDISLFNLIYIMCLLKVSFNWNVVVWTTHGLIHVTTKQHFILCETIVFCSILLLLCFNIRVSQRLEELHWDLMPWPLHLTGRVSPNSSTL